MANEFIIKNGFVSKGNSIVEGILSGQTFNLINTPVNNNAATEILVRNSTTGVVEYRDSSTLSGGGGGQTITGYTYDETTNKFSIDLSGGTSFDATITVVSGLTVTSNLIVSGNTGMGTDTPTEKLHIVDGEMLIDYDQNDNSKIIIKNTNTGSEARVGLSLVADGLDGFETTGTITYIGDNFNSVGTFQGLYLPNSLNITTGGAGPDERAHINIGPRATTGETRFFSGGDDFDNNTLIGRFFTSGLTTTDDKFINTDRIRIRGGSVNGYVLTSDADGIGTWAPASGSSGTSIFVTGATYNSGTTSLDFSGTSGFSPFSVSLSAISTNTFVTGATLNGTDLEIGRNDGQSQITVDLSSLAVDNNVFVDGGNADVATQQLTFTNTTGGTFNVTNAASLFSDNDINVTGGTYNANTGCVTFETNSGSTFDICGFVTGLTNTFVSGGTYDSNTSDITFTNTTGGTFNVDLSSLSGSTLWQTENGGLKSYTPTTGSINGTSTGALIAGGFSTNEIFSGIGSTILNGSSNIISGSTVSAILSTQNSSIKSNPSAISDISHATIVGGFSNTIEDTTGQPSERATLLGGSSNIIDGGLDSAIIGGSLNTIREVGSGIYTSTESSISGGSRSAIVGGIDHILDGTNSIILGGNAITGTSDNTVYVPNLNVGSIGSGTPLINLGLDSSGNVVTGTTSGGGTMSFTVEGDNGTPFTISSGDTLEFVGFPGINVGVADPEVRIALDYSGADSFILEATNGTGITVDGANDKLVIYDNDTATVKYINANQLPSSGAASTPITGYSYNSDNNTFTIGLSGGTSFDSQILGVSGITVANSIDLGEYIIHSGDTNTYFGFNGTDSIVAFTNASRKLRIGTNAVDLEYNGSTKLSTISNGVFVDGSLGVGTDNPTEKLDVRGDVLITNPSSSSVLTLSGSVLNNSVIDFDNTGVSTPFARIEGSTFGGGTSGNLQFYTYPSAGSLSEVMVLTNNQRVGIGDIANNDVDKTLHVKGDFKMEETGAIFDSDLNLSSGANVRLSAATTDQLPRISVSSPGDGGIAMGARGSTEASFPGYGANGDGYLYSSIDQNGLNIISAPSSPAGTLPDYIRMYAGQDASGGIPDIHIQGRATTDSVRGYVGIHTDTPTETLHVDGTVRIVDGTEQLGYVLTCDADGVSSWQPSSGGTSGGTVYWQTESGGLKSINQNAGTISGTSTGAILIGGYFTNNNITDGRASTIINGGGNIITGASASAIISTNSSSIIGNGSTIQYSVIVGGQSNTINGSSDNALIGGGTNNEIIDGPTSSIVGGTNNTIDDCRGGIYTSEDSILDKSFESVIIGGSDHSMDASSRSVIVGGIDNLMDNVSRSIILGGTNITASTSDTVYVPNLNIGTIGNGTPLINLGLDSNGFVVTGTTTGSTTGYWEEGGSSNDSIFDTKGGQTINGAAINSIIAGGETNLITEHDYSGIFAGSENKITGSTLFNETNNVIIGGNSNIIGTTLGYAEHNSILGGTDNTIDGRARRTTLIGGTGNSILNSVDDSSIIGGNNNEVKSTRSVVLGGTNITATTTSDTVYVPKLNVRDVGSGTPLINLGLDSNGFVVTGTTGSGSTTSLWEVSGTSNEVLIDKKGSSSYTVNGQSDGAIIAAGTGHTLTNTQYGAFLGGINNTIINSSSLIGSDVQIGGVGSTISGFTGTHYGNINIGGSSNLMVGSVYNTMLSTSDSRIFGGNNNFIIGGGNHKNGIDGYGLYQNTSSGIIGGTNNTFASGVDRSVIIGGNGLSATTDDTVYVPNLNINSIGASTPIGNLGFDSSGNVVTGTSGGSAFSWSDPVVTSGNTSADCIDDLYVTNLHSCSPLFINPENEGDVYFGSSSGVTIQTASAKIGIGTTSPISKLHVNNGDILLSNENATLTISSSTVGGSGEYENTINFKSDGSNQSDKIDAHIRTESTGTRSNLFFGAIASSTLRDKMVLTGRGRLGLGTNSPDSTIHISGSGIQQINVTSTNGNSILKLKSDDGSNAYIDFEETSGNRWLMGSYNVNDKFVWATGSTFSSGGLMALTQDGDLGVGNISPSSRLHVNTTNIEFLPTLGNDNVALFESDNETEVAIVGDASRNVSIKMGDKDGLPGQIFYSNANDQFQINANGTNVLTLSDSTIINQKKVQLQEFGTGSAAYNLQVSQVGSGEYEIITGNTGADSGSCISELWVTNLESCSPLHVNTQNQGDIYFGDQGGGIPTVTLDITTVGEPAMYFGEESFIKYNETDKKLIIGEEEGGGKVVLEAEGLETVEVSKTSTKINQGDLEAESGNIIIKSGNSKSLIIEEIPDVGGANLGTDVDGKLIDIPSDSRVKDNVIEIPNVIDPLQFIQNVKGYQFEFKPQTRISKTGKKHYGFKVDEFRDNLINAAKLTDLTPDELEINNIARTFVKKCKTRFNLGQGAPIEVDAMNYQDLIPFMIEGIKQLDLNVRNIDAGISNKFVVTQTLSSGSNIITHSLNDENVIVQVIDVSTGHLIIPNKVTNYLLDSLEIDVELGGEYKIIIIA